MLIMKIVIMDPLKKKTKKESVLIQNNKKCEQYNEWIFIDNLMFNDILLTYKWVKNIVSDIQSIQKIKNNKFHVQIVVE